MSHTLHVVEHPNGWTIQNELNECVAQQYGGSDIAYARRIVACVNACAGIETKFVEILNVNNMMENLERFEQRNAELVEALNKISRGTEDAQPPFRSIGAKQMVEIADKALAAQKVSS